MTTSQRILILGGTSWLGGTVARTARDRGHQVTCLARGEAGKAPDGVRFVQADRWQPGAYDEVSGQDWDAVIEVSWQPDLVRSALSAIAPRASHWVYVSTLSVYADHSTPDADESAETLEPWEGTGEVDVENYGSAKVSCETSCAEAVPAERLAVVRPGLITGYGDLSDRFGYWPARIARVESSDTAVLTPPMDVPVQVIDVEDLAVWLVDLAESRVSGTYDAVGDVFPFVDLVGLCAGITGKDPTFAAAGQNWLVNQEVTPWAGDESLPLWLPVPEYAGMMTHRNDAAKKAGLTLRPLEETVRSALNWERELGLNRARTSGLSRERETMLLEAMLGDVLAEGQGDVLGDPLA